MIKLKCIQNKNKTFLSNSLNLCALSTSCIPIRIISYCRIPLTRHYFLEQKTLTISPDIIPPTHAYTIRVPQKKTTAKKRRPATSRHKSKKMFSILRAAYKTPKPPMQ